MYVWNGFKVVGKRPELTETILSTLDKAEEQLQNDPCETTESEVQRVFGASRTNGLCDSSIRVPPGRPVRPAAAEGPVSRSAGTLGPS